MIFLGGGPDPLSPSGSAQIIKMLKLYYAFHRISNEFGSEWRSYMSAHVVLNSLNELKK